MTTSTHLPLPRIGQPALRALASIGVTGLEQLPAYRAADLLALHGIGPRAIRILEEALAAHGLAFKRDAAELPPEVQAHIDALPATHRPLFDRLHALILDELPDAEVVISYRIPLYKVGKRHVGLNTRRADGVTLTTTSPEHIEAFRRAHPQFRTNKASIVFGLDDEIPEEAVREVIRRATRS
jgi:hypothetical protein